MRCDVLKIHHTGITVRDLDESARFYEEYFGFKRIGGCEIAVGEEGSMKGVKIKIAFF